MTDETFAETFRRLLTEESKQMSANLDEQLLTIRQHVAYMPVSVEALLDAGAIAEAEARAQGWTPPVPVKTPWYRRLRWRWHAWRERAGRKVGGWIAGVDLSEREDEW